MQFKKLFSLHGELGYFSLFDGQLELAMLIIGPRGFGKSEFFSMFMEQFNDNYIKFTPVASDGIIFQQNIQGTILGFETKGNHVSIRGKDNIDWNRKIPIETRFEKDFQISRSEFKFGIVLVGALGVETISKQDMNKLIKQRGHRIRVCSGINLIRIRDPQRYLFELVRDLIEKPSDWLQLEIYRSGRLGRIDSEYRLFQEISEYLPTRILELTLPEDKNKWGQLRDIFKAVVLKLDRLIISTVEYKLSLMIQNKTKRLLDQIQHEWKFPEDRQLPDLSGIPEMLMMNEWLSKKVKMHGEVLDLPIKVKQNIESGLLTIQTAFVEDLGTALKAEDHISTAQELQKNLTIHSIAIGDLLTEITQKTSESKELLDSVTSAKEDISALDDFLDKIIHGRI
jgi:hypothetical protein